MGPAYATGTPADRRPSIPCAPWASRTAGSSSAIACSCAATRSTTRTSGSCSGDGEALVIDTRSTHVQAREIVARPARADARPGDGRRRHARPLRPRLRQSRLPARDDLGPRALRDVHGADRRGAPAGDRARGTRPRGRPGRGRHRSARSDVRRRRDDRGRRARGRAPLPRPRPHRPRHRHLGPGDRTSCSPATCSRTAPSRSSATATRSTGRRPRPRSLPLVGDGVVVPGHGDHAGRAFAERQAASFTALAALARRVTAGELTLDAAVAAHPFDEQPPEHARGRSSGRSRSRGASSPSRPGRPSDRGPRRRRSRRARRRGCRGRPRWHGRRRRAVAGRSRGGPRCAAVARSAR